VVRTGSGFVSNNPEYALDGERGAQGGAWVMHGNLSAAFAVLALPAQAQLHCINVYSGVGLPDGHVTEMAVWVTDTIYDGYTAQRLTSPEMLALKARWTEVELSGVAGGEHKRGLRDLPAAAPRTRRVRGSSRRIHGSWLRVGARLRRINAEHMSLSLYSLIEIGGQRRWRSGVRANGLKVKFLSSDAAGNGCIVTEIELLAAPAPLPPLNGGSEKWDGGMGHIRVVWPRDLAVLPRPIESAVTPQQPTETIGKRKENPQQGARVAVLVEWRISRQLVGQLAQILKSQYAVILFGKLY